MDSGHRARIASIIKWSGKPNWRLLSLFISLLSVASDSLLFYLLNKNGAFYQDIFQEWNKLS